jgi:hypothetical protein
LLSSCELIILILSILPLTRQPPDTSSQVLESYYRQACFGDRFPDRLLLTRPGIFTIPCGRQVADRFQLTCNTSLRSIVRALGFQPKGQNPSRSRFQHPFPGDADHDSSRVDIQLHISCWHAALC